MRTTHGHQRTVWRVVKQYDRAYFDRWYRREGFGSRARLERKVRYAVAAAEYLLERPVRSVLDVGCGEGAWQPVLRRVRPAASYRGVDPSEYAIERYGTRRNLTLGGVADLDALDLEGPYDLVVCIDVLPYVPDTDAQHGIASIARLAGGVALVELFTSVDDFEGDRTGYHRRTPSRYEQWFRRAGLVRIGPNLFAPSSFTRTLAYFERPRSS